MKNLFNNLTKCQICGFKIKPSFQIDDGDSDYYFYGKMSIKDNYINLKIFDKPYAKKSIFEAKLFQNENIFIPEKLSKYKEKINIEFRSECFKCKNNDEYDLEHFLEIDLSTGNYKLIYYNKTIQNDFINYSNYMEDNKIKTSIVINYEMDFDYDLDLDVNDLNIKKFFSLYKLQILK